jgi:linoleoyl-CoA desaturase
VHYAKLAPIVERTAKEFGIPYHNYGSFRKALINHKKMLFALGRPKLEVA